VAKIIQISFKEKEKEIYDFVHEHSYPSAYVKDLIIKDFNEQKKKEQENNIPIRNAGMFDMLD
jgi:hypothetical protein